MQEVRYWYNTPARRIRITVTPEEHDAMNKALADFAQNPLEYDLSEMMDEDGIQEMARDMLQVEYPNSFLLDMGWYQDRYIISIIQNFDWTHPVQQYETAERNQLPKLLTEAVRLVEKESQSAGAN